MKSNLNYLVLECIKEYESKIIYSSRLLALEFGHSHDRTNSVIMLYKEGKIPSQGKIGDISFFFHGMGCRLDYGSFIVDFDYGPCGIVGGIDMYKMNSFIKSISYTRRFERINSIDILQDSFNHLCEKGFLFMPDHLEYQNMFYRKNIL